MIRQPKGLRWAALGLIAVLGLVAASCTDDNVDSGSSGSGGGGAEALDGEVKLGFTADLSGRFSGNGIGLRNGFQAYVDYANENGGFGGKKGVAVILDDASDTPRGVANVTQMITQDQVAAVGGFLLSNICSAAEPLATTSKIPLMCSSVSGDMLNPVKPVIFTQSPSQDWEAMPMANMANDVTKKESGQKVALVTFASASSLVLRDEWLKIGEDRDWDVVLDAQVPLTATDVSAQAAQIIAAKPDVVLTSLADTLQILLMRTLKSEGSTTPVVNYDGASTQALNTLQDPNYNLLSAFAYTDETDGFKEYAKIITDAGFKPLDPFVNRGYLQAMMFKKAMDACKACTGEDLSKALEGLEFETNGFTAGPVKFSKDNHQGQNTYYVYKWDTAKSAIVPVATDLKSGRAQEAAAEQ